MGRITPPTLNRRLGASSGDGTHASHHEVTEELVRRGGLGGHVSAEVRDLVGLVAALEGRAVGEGRARAGVLPGGRGREGADGERREGRRLGHAPQADAGSVRESRHREGSWGGRGVGRGDGVRGRVWWLRSFSLASRQNGLDDDFWRFVPEAGFELTK